MNIAQIEQNLKNLLLNFNKETFIYEFLLAYGLPKSSITLLQKGNLNLSKVEGEISWKEKVFFKPVFNQDLHAVITQMQSQVKNKQRFVIVTDFKILLAIDTKTNDSLDIDFMALNKHFDFFMPWAGIEKATHKKETEADVKAAEKMAKLFDEIKKDNPDNSPDFIHSLNVFLSRLLFCYFAEDTEIFTKDLFSHSIKNHTQTDGSDLADYLDKLFTVMNLPPNDKARLALPDYLQKFPYVNGGLFAKPIKSPNFTRRSRQALLDSGSENWSKINPDIFGSMIQAVITPEHRGGLGMHYTSVPNIMKLIEPLFLNELNQEFTNAKHEPRKLNNLLARISKIKIFDPACGSGNFLIIAYKELRILEIKILQQLQTLQQAATGFEKYQEELELIPKTQLTLAAQYKQELFSRIELAQFYGIELDDFAHEIAILSLWLAQHQMNMGFKAVFGTTNPTLPLQAGGNIIHGNATRENWETVCPKKKDDEIYILGNPPFLGTRNQKKEHKEDMIFALKNVKNYKTLDYISCWFYKASNYIVNSNSKYAFVTTNSISQGDQVSVLWNTILLNNQLEIDFAHQSFKWENNAKANAGVTVLIIGLRNTNLNPKYLYNNDLKKSAKNINPYIVDGSNVIIGRLSKSISNFPKMIKGSIPADGGNLILNEFEFEELSKNKKINNVIKKFIGAQEIIDKVNRWCLYIDDERLEDLILIPEIKKRLDLVVKMREESTKLATQKLALYPHKFAEDRYFNQNCILIPCVTSEQRRYIPIDFVDKEPVIYASAQAIYNPEHYIFSIVTSSIHTIWIKAVCGSLETRIRYSSSLGYNTFPFPPISKSQKEELEQCVFRILEERENHSEKTLAQLYDPKDMPDGLREAHRLNDLAVERCYRSKPFDTDEERLEYLFKLYEQMIADENEKGTLFETEKKASKKKTKAK
ncbi:DNA methyltransferase [Flavobacterium luteum]|uniref:site-specific DNA-methyltransferase (adenine-specific) n=1 Tax=Flavobacterium luteum TaxID=2026654 RepID=A0A7J5AKS3_9FLAO|nr:DNA methyltransferase [Flavobacterium luteum]KAB1158113.1 class I SAM-dependent DNA methyltransferase [Flavobacterium luteum]